MIKPLILKYPVNKQLHKVLTPLLINRLGAGKTTTSNKGGRRTPFDLHTRRIKEIDELAAWVRSMMPRVAAHFAGLKKGEICSFLVEALEITHMWGVLYEKGDDVYPHNHFPFAVSFGYYIRTPKGCSPLKIENKKIKMQAGQCIFFLGSSWHNVLPEPVGGRCMIAGNILYSDSKAITSNRKWVS